MLPRMRRRRTRLSCKCVAAGLAAPRSDRRARVGCVRPAHRLRRARGAPAATRWLRACGRPRGALPRFGNARRTACARSLRRWGDLGLGQLRCRAKTTGAAPRATSRRRPRRCCPLQGRLRCRPTARSTLRAVGGCSRRCGSLRGCRPRLVDCCTKSNRSRAEGRSVRGSCASRPRAEHRRVGLCRKARVPWIPRGGRRSRRGSGQPEGPKVPMAST